MSLFVINRYEGEKLEEPSKEDHLTALLNKIEERKRQRALNKTDDEKTKKKKRKNEKSSETNIDQGTLIEEESEIIPDDVFFDNKVNEEINKLSITKGEIEEEIAQEKPVFTILGSSKHVKTCSVKRVLPGWLAHPEMISSDLSSGLNFEDMEYKLDPEFIEILKANNVSKLFPVQNHVISWLLQCENDRKIGRWLRDTCVCAPTGSGKTLAYVLPILQILKSRFVRKVRCLVVLPGQELAAQVYKVMLTYSVCTRLKVGLISGASSFEEEQTKIIKKTSYGEYESRVDVIVATPGRLVDHIEKTEGFSLDNLRFLVIDEADKATDWLQHIPAPHSKAPPLTLANIRSCTIPPAQKVLLSATLSQDPEKLCRLGLFQPILFTTVALSGGDEDLDLDKLQEEHIGRYIMPENLLTRIVKCSMEYKPLALFRLLIKLETFEKTLVFTNSGYSTHRLAILLQIMLKDKNITVKELSSQLMSKQREDTLKNFAHGKFQVLVCSDALARGLDIPGVTLVVSYDPPKYVKGYIHRIGRTGRAGVVGTAISILAPNQIDSFTRMLSSSHITVPEIEHEELESFAELINYQGHLESLKESLNKQHTEHLKRLKATKRRHKS